MASSPSSRSSITALPSTPATTSANAALAAQATRPSHTTASTQSAVFTLFEGTYHLGAAALFNSLYLAGFRGTCYAGVRGPVPTWTTALPDGTYGLEAAEGFAVRMIPLESAHHLTNVKPLIFQQLWADACENVPALFYFDPDIVVKRTWSYFENWAQHGVTLVEDVNSAMPANHPTRRAWETFAHSAGYVTKRSVEHYYNGGFVGGLRAHSAFFSQWADLLRHADGTGAAALSAFSQRSDQPPYIRFPDQDTLNITVMCSDVPVSTVSNAEMDFTPGGTLMSHALGRPKPWSRTYLRRAWQGVVPSNADKLFWQAAGTGPIRAFPDAILRRQRRLLALASAVGRIYRRN